MKTVVSLFDTHEDADRAVTALQAAGYDRDAISVMASDRMMPDYEPDNAEAPEADPEVRLGRRTGTGALGGSVAGGLAGLLVGLGLITIPGIGPIMAAGTLATTIASTAAGAGIGAATGGIIGALTGIGLTDEEAEFYAEGVKRGGVLVLVDTEDENARQAKLILDQANGVNMDVRREAWQNEGWVHFDEDFGSRE